jgi:phospholipase C
MSIISDHDIDIVGHEVRFNANSGESRTLQVGDFYDVFGDVVGGMITVSIIVQDFHNPTYSKSVGNPAEDEFEEGTNCVAISIELYRGDEPEPVQTFVSYHGPRPSGTEEMIVAIDSGPIVNNSTKWHLHIRNTSHPAKVVQAICGFRFTRARDYIGETRIPLRVLNHAFGVVLDAFAPYFDSDGHTYRFGFSNEIATFLNLPNDHPLRGQTFPLPDGVNIQGELQTLKAEVLSGSALVTVLNQLLADPLGALQEVLADLQEKITNEMSAVHITALLSTIDLSTDVVPGFDFDLASVENGAIHLYLIFGQTVAESYVIMSVNGEFGGIIPNLADLASVNLPGTIRDSMTTAIDKYLVLIHRYFAEVLGRMAPFIGEIPSIFISSTSTEDSLLVRYTHDPADQRATLPVHPSGTGHPHGGPSHFDLGSATVGGGDIPAASTAGDPFDPGPLGVLPAGFEIGDDASVARLDRIDTIVVVMMENRSFDHILGYLRTLRGEDYEGFSDDASNTYLRNDLSYRVNMTSISNVLPAERIYQIPAEPYHEYAHVKLQIDDGKMDGFAQDLLPISDPQFALTYYTDTEIPNYYRMAERHLVCDQWYCAHPGSTHPNRWATLTGSIRQLDNIAIDDRQLGFLREKTIFDELTAAGIEWNYFENNVSMLRMFQNYRLDNKNVIPFLDKDEGFQAKAKAGTLPPIVFIDPRFVDLPPLEQASDDHPPASLVPGQQFITAVYNILAESAQWTRSLLVITYDEHGGFFDHMPPPGTLRGPTEWIAKVPRIHPEGADSMGPRVPTFLISPFVNQGSVSHAIFDHTSILKTILVRHRTKFHSYQFAAFGPRVMMINHLGVALNRDHGVPGNPTPLPGPPLRQPINIRTHQSVGTPKRRPTDASNGARIDDFGVSLARAMLPKKS